MPNDAAVMPLHEPCDAFPPYYLRALEGSADALEKKRVVVDLIAGHDRRASSCDAQSPCGCICRLSHGPDFQMSHRIGVHPLHVLSNPVGQGDGVAEFFPKGNTPSNEKRG